MKHSFRETARSTVSVFVVYSRSDRCSIIVTRLERALACFSYHILLLFRTFRIHEFARGANKTRR